MNTETFQKNLSKLNPEQRRAVETLDGPVMVIAGPGTGKTQIIGMRTANIILNAGVHANNILITTFTEAGVIAIRERLVSMIGSDAYKVQVSTIHSFAQDVIKSFPEKFTLEKMNTPIDGIDGMEIISSIVADCISRQELKYLTSYGDTLFYVRDIFSTIGKLKGEGVSPVRFEKIIAEETEKSLEWLEEKRNNKRIKKIENYELEHEKKIGKLSELLMIYRKYNEALKHDACYDFNDMIQVVLDAFQKDNELRAYFAESYQYVMLDEYQDTNNPQNEIINLMMLLSERPNIMVVGDDDQSIYRFQGANIENMLDFTTLYPDALLIVLDKNYRSQQGILDAASQLISENSERLINRIPGLEKNIISQKDTEIIIPSLYSAPSDIHERLYILQEIKRLKNLGHKLSEIAIIVRSNAEVSLYSGLLKEQDIPVVSKFETNILTSDIVLLLLSFLKTLDNPFEAETEILNFLRSSFSGIPTSEVLKISHYLYRENYVRRGNKRKVIDVLQDRVQLEIIGVSSIHEIDTFIEIFFSLSQSFSQKNILFALGELFQKFGFFETEKNNMSFDDIQDINTFFYTIKSWLVGGKNLSLSDILARIELYRKYNYRIERIVTNVQNNGVQIVTAHSSKGLEYEYVFIPGLYSGNWDSKTQRQLIPLPEGIAGNGIQFAQLENLSDAAKKKYLDDRQMQEDRRLFFVALTRAKKQLFLSYPMSISGKIKIISPFMSEIASLQEVLNFEVSQDDIASQIIGEIIEESKFIDYSSQEIEFIETFIQNYKLSASDFNTFLVNPKDFLYRTIFKYPFEENENSIFGTMYHRTLELFYKKIQETGEVQDFEYMKFVFERQLEKEFLSSEERIRLRTRGLDALQGYFNTYNGSFVAPLKTEYKFSRRNIFFDDIPLTGIIDKIELLDENFSANISGGSLFSQVIKITDYKTGSTKYLGDIKGQDKDGKPDEGYERGKYGRQLMFYKLLFENDNELSSMYHLGALELDFCEGKNGKYKRVEVEFSDEEYETFKILLKETYKKMTDIEFWKQYLSKNKEL